MNGERNSGRHFPGEFNPDERLANLARLSGLSALATVHESGAFSTSETVQLMALLLNNQADHLT